MTEPRLPAPAPEPPPDRAPLDDEPVESLYVHAPWCVTLCPYCDFYSLEGGAEEAPGYLRTLEAELDVLEARGDLPTGPVRTVFVGGGTPTRLGAEGLAGLCALLRRRLDLSAVAEFTVEGNPESLDADAAAALADGGATRVSMGAQSFDPGELEWLGRVHDADAIERAAACVADAGLRLSLDLILAVPGQTEATLARSLERALTLVRAAGPAHVSAYVLTWEPGTVITRDRDRGRRTPPGEDAELDRLHQARDALGAAGLERYEISNWAEPGAACRHNLAVWDNRAYLGLGPGAWSFCAGERRGNVRSVHAWRGAVEAGLPAWSEREHLDRTDRARETAAFALRTARGLDREALARRTGVAGDWLTDALRPHLEAGLVTEDGPWVRPTDRGFDLADRVASDLLAAPIPAS